MKLFEEFISEKKIKTVIDLRAEKEVAESNYTENSLKNFIWVHTPFDPWSQSIEFQATHHQGSNMEIAYRFFSIECKHSIKKAVEAILQEQKFYCHSLLCRKRQNRDFYFYASLAFRSRVGNSLQ
ncbi:MAG: tyrosine-protein phosphatase [Bacteroidales bacterium]|nr:tyrosine-protein phosphatase [Bacteroidales bacterium]